MDISHDSLSQQRFDSIPPCGTCGGVPPSSGLPCVCGGRNTVYAEVQGLRESYFDLQRSTVQLEADLAAMRGALERIANLETDPLGINPGTAVMEAKRALASSPGTALGPNIQAKGDM